MKSQSANRILITATALILFIWMGASPLCSQDITLRETTTTAGAPMGGGGKPMTATNYCTSNAMSRTSPDGNDFIIRYDQQKTITIDHKKKTYSEMTFAQMQEMMDKAMSEMGKDKESIEALRQIMGQSMGQVSVTKQGAGESIAGYSTEKYLIKIPPMEIEVWSAPDLKIPGAYYDMLKMRTPRNPMFDMGKMYDEFKKIKGMTMKSVTTMKMMGMNMTTTTVVTSVEKGSIPASTFEIPAGYKSAPFKN